MLSLDNENYQNNTKYNGIYLYKCLVIQVRMLCSMQFLTHY